MKRLGILFATIVLSACTSTAPPSPDVPAVPPPPEFAHIPFYRAGEGMEGLKPLERIDPRSTRELRQSVMKASATVEFVVDERGRVIAAWYVDGHREWAKIVIAALRQWRWQPAMRDGRPIAVRSRLTSRLRT